MDVGHVEPKEGVYHVANTLLKPPSVLSNENDALIKDNLSNKNKRKYKKKHFVKQKRIKGNKSFYKLNVPATLWYYFKNTLSIRMLNPPCYNKFWFTYQCQKPTIVKLKFTYVPKND